MAPIVQVEETGTMIRRVNAVGMVEAKTKKIWAGQAGGRCNEWRKQRLRQAMMDTLAMEGGLSSTPAPSMASYEDGWIARRERSSALFGPTGYRCGFRQQWRWE